MTRVDSAPILTLRRPRESPRNYPANVDDFDVIGPDGKVIGRIFKPGGVRSRLDVVLVGGGSAAAAQSRLRGHAQRPLVRLSARRGSKRRRDKRCTLRRARLLPMRWMRNLGSHPRENSGQAIDVIGEPAGTRTQDHLIKSQVLYHLSYGLLARSV